MDRIHSFSRSKLGTVATVLFLIYLLLVLSIFYECRKLAVNEAERSLEGFLLTHRAIKCFFESVQKEELYRLKEEKILAQEYFSPQLFSSSFIIRQIVDAQNRERRQSGHDELFFKFASNNPRNSFNQANPEELTLLQKFNAGDLTDYKIVSDNGDDKYLYYALPIPPNTEACLNCHGVPEKAPRELLQQYGNSAGFYETVGKIRALMSVQVPLSGLMREANQAAIGISMVSFLLFSGIFWAVYVYLGKMEVQESIRRRLRKAEKMESIGLMAGGVAHDLNNILAGIINYPELLLRRLPPDNEMRRPLKLMQQSGQRAAAVVADLLTVARGVVTRKEPCELSQLINEQLESPEVTELKKAWPQVQLTLVAADVALPLLCSAIHVKKSFYNLLANAFEASCRQCRVSTGQRNFTTAEAGQYNALPGDYCFVRVEDSGSGISGEDLQHIFEPFYSTKKMGKSGTGLGLSVVWNTVKDHNGIVTIDSTENGSVFSLYFPISTEPASAMVANVQTLDLRGAGETILIVDDEAHLCDIASRILTDFNYSAVSVASGEAALEYLKKHSVDLILLDMLMEPGMNGCEVYKKITQMNPTQKAIVASGFCVSDDVRDCLDLGASVFLKKPYSAEELGRAVFSAFQSPKN